MEATLIEEVKKHEVLYKRSSLAYRNKFERAAAWNSIADKLNVPENICQVRWKTLRDRFVKEHAETHHVSESGAELEKNTWQYYHQMKFLREHIKSRKIQPQSTTQANTMEAKLIAEVKKHEVLYKKSLPAYRNKFKRTAAWNSIADKLNVSENICQARWKTLRDRFVKEHAETHHVSESGAELEENPWQYYQQMEFLSDHIKTGKTNSQSDIQANTMEERLIAEVKKHEVLYKRSSLAYRNKLQRAAAWNSISDKLNVPENICQARWKTLRDQFVKKYTETSESGAELEENPWQYYHQMEFLHEDIKPRKTKSQITLQENTMEEKLIEEMKKHEVLYKNSSLAYRNKLKRTAAGNSIPNKLNVTENIRKKHTETHYSSGSGAESEENQWQYYQQMEFQCEDIKPRKTVTPQSSPEYAEKASTDPLFSPLVLEEEFFEGIENLEEIDNSDSHKSSSIQSEVPSSSRKRSRRGSDCEAFKDILEKILKIADTRFAVPSTPTEHGAHEGFFSMVREIFEDLPKDTVRNAKFFFLDYLRDQVVAKKRK